ncbi:lysophospholipase I [Trametes elegans]|nr:lysophospholipase I [Trametes elegans]
MDTPGCTSTLGDLLVLPPKATHSATVIFVHGLGQHRDLWIPVLQKVVDRLPGVKWILPQAPSVPVTYYGGLHRPSWFDIANFPPRNHYDETGIGTSVSTIERLVMSEVRSGTESTRIFLVGFSQGAALCLMTALTTLHELGGVVSLSGWIPEPSRQAMHPLEPNLPVFWAHGVEDIEIPLSYGQECATFLREELHIPEDKITFKMYEGLEHTVNDAELDDLAHWLSRHLD